MNESDLVIVGGGPKAAAIAIKAHVLNQLGLAALRVTVVEASELAAAWTGNHGFTSGAELLGTRPEKDVGFPYRTAAWLGEDGRAVDRQMLQHSWHSHLVDVGGYRRWVDMGAPETTHRQLARYLDWVFARATDGVDVVRARVESIQLDDAAWTLRCRRSSGSGALLTARRGLVLTGAGHLRPLPAVHAVASRVLTPVMERHALSAALASSRGGRLCVVGGGESAAALALHLLAEHGERLAVTFVSPTLASSRAESFLENEVFSAPETIGWSQLPEGSRLDFIRRTDRGVMSPAAVAQLARHAAVSYLPGRVRLVEASPAGRLQVVIDQPDEVVRLEFDFVANCTGFSPLEQLRSLIGAGAARIEEQIGISLDNGHAVMREINAALALRGLLPRLHIPAMAALAQGPGFANLSSLGLLSDRILSAHVEPPRGRHTNDSPEEMVADAPVH